MALRLPAGWSAALTALEPEVRSAADAMGMALAPAVDRLRPGMTRLDDPEPLLEGLPLGPEAEPDPVSLAGVLALHSAYVRRRGAADGVSLGALAIGRLLVWTQRAALLGPAPHVAWIGPEARRPPGVEGTAIPATATVSAAGARRSARAVALVRPGSRDAPA